MYDRRGTKLAFKAVARIRIRRDYIYCGYYLSSQAFPLAIVEATPTRPVAIGAYGVIDDVCDVLHLLFVAIIHPYGPLRVRTVAILSR